MHRSYKPLIFLIFIALSADFKNALHGANLRQLFLDNDLHKKGSVTAESSL